MDEHCHVELVGKSPTEEERQATATALLSIEGMGCENCARRVRNSLLSVYGVVGVEIALGLGIGKVLFNPRLADSASLTSAVERAGGDGRHEYRARVVS